MTELNNRQAEAAVAENPVIAGWQKEASEEAACAVRKRQPGRHPGIIGGVQLSGSGNYCALMDLMRQHVLRAC